MNGEAFQHACATPLFGVATTVIAYAIATRLHGRFRWLHPLLVSCGLLIALLLAARIPLASYQVGGDVITFFLGPATVALGVPLYKQAKRLGPALPGIATAVAAGSTVGVASAAGLVRLAGGSDDLLRAMLTKSVTSPIAVELARQIGASPQLASGFVVLAGVLGSMVGPAVLRRCGVRGDVAIGAAVGTASHGIGVARLVQDSDLQAGAGALSMALAGIFTSALMVPVGWWFAR